MGADLIRRGGLAATELARQEAALQQAQPGAGTQSNSRTGGATAIDAGELDRGAADLQRRAEALRQIQPSMDDGHLRAPSIKFN